MTTTTLGGLPVATSKMLAACQLGLRGYRRFGATIRGLLISMSLIPCSALAADVCTSTLDNATQSEAFWNSVVELLSWGDDEPKPKSVRPRVFVTSSSGFARAASCGVGGKRQYERSMFYPLGVAVKEIRREMILVDGQQSEYVMGVAEYGLVLFFLASHLTEILPAEELLFADGPPVRYCIGSPKCNPADARFVLNGKDRYARVRNSPQGGACGWIEIEPIDRGGVSTGENAFVDTCARDSDGAPARNGELKRVTLASLEARFGEQPTGAFHRFGSDFVKRVLPAVVSMKDCNQKMTVTASASAAGGLSVGLKLGVVNLEGQGQAEVQRTLIEDYGEEYFLRYSTYARRLQSDEHPTVEDMAFAAACKKDNPFKLEKPLAILIFGTEFGQDGRLTFDAADVVNKEYWPSAATIGIAPVTDTDSLRRGFFWRIKGSDQYFLWRTAIRSHILKNAAFEEMAAQDSPQAKLQLADFLTHLIIAAGFLFD